MKLRQLAVAMGLLVIGGFALAPTSVLADGDPAKGAKVFKKCKACHEAEKEKNKVGPHLVGIIGRPIAGLESYAGKYSKDMEALAGKVDGGVWTAEFLAEYLEKPKKFVPKTKMAFAGLRKEKDREDLVAYLKSLQ